MIRGMGVGVQGTVSGERETERDRESVLLCACLRVFLGGGVGCCCCFSLIEAQDGCGETMRLCCRLSLLGGGGGGC